MANLRDIKRRISSVESMQKIMSAMKMLSVAKLRRAQQAVEAARPYSVRMRETLEEVAGSSTDAENALLEVRDEVKKVAVVGVSSDRGLAGAFNNQIIKVVERLVAGREEQGQQVELTLVGRRIGDFFKRRRSEQIGLSEPTGPHITYPQAAAIARRLIRGYEAGEIDQAVIVYNQFVTTMSQTPRTETLLPIVPRTSEDDAEGEAPAPHTIEPDAQKLLATLAPKAVEVAVFQALLENQAGEHAARMTAMESATKNTQELIDQLTLDFNRARQAAITRELVEIVTGAQALEG